MGSKSALVQNINWTEGMERGTVVEVKDTLNIGDNEMTLFVISTSKYVSLDRLTGGSIQTPLHITPWCNCEVEQLVRVTGSEGVVGVSDVTH